MSTLKDLVLLFFLAVLFSCGPARKIEKVDVKIDSSLSMAEASRVDLHIDTTLRESGVLEIVKLTFEKPDPGDKDPPEIRTPGGATLKGTLKEAEITTIKSETERSGVSDQKSEAVSNMEKSTEIREKKDKDIKKESKIPLYVSGFFAVVLLWWFVHKKPPNFWRS